ncbi:MAG TPA: ABC transporter substrate-binding protein [Chloroflexota bacterium]|nr:ABC transporter substrate-binding protein [Chloroflexota bacterium]
MCTPWARPLPPVLFALLALLTGCTARSAPPAPLAASPVSSPTPEPVRLTVPYTPIAGTSAPLWIAVLDGLFLRQGLDVSIEFFSGGSVPIIQSMVAGEYPLGIPGGGDVLLNRLGGGDLLLIGMHMGFFVIDAYAKPEIRSIADLKGRRIAVTRIGTSTYFAGVAALASAGIKPDEVSFVQSGGVNESLAVLMAGGADAAMIGYPAGLRAEQAGFPRLFTFAELGAYGLYPTAVVATRDSWLREPRNRDIALRFLRALNEGLQLARTNEAAFKRAIRQYMQIEDEAMLQATFEYFRMYLPPSLRVEERAIQNALQFIDHPAAREADPRQFIDNSLVEALEREGR